MAAVVAVVIGIDALATDVCLRLGGAGSRAEGADRFAGIGIVVAGSAASASRLLLVTVIGLMRVALPMLSSLCVFLLLLAFLCAASSSSNLTQFCLPPAASSGTSKAISCSGCETVAGCVGACCSPLSDMFGSVLVVLCNVGECFYSFVVYLFRIFLIAALVIYAF